MRKLLFFVLIALMSACSESSLEPVLVHEDENCTNVLDNQDFVSISRASEVASLFMAQNVQASDAETRGVPAFDSSKNIESIKTVYGEDKMPSMYVINYEGGGFVIVSATKNYYPILAYSETNSIDVGEAMETGFSIWADETKQCIEESSSQDEETLAEFRRMWISYETPTVNITPLNATDDNYRDGTLFRQRMSELYTLCPGYSFGPLTSARSFLSQSEYDSYVQKAELYGSPLEFTIVGYKSPVQGIVGPLINTTWDQENNYNALCPNNSLAGCVAIAMAQIMKYYEWPQTYDWGNMANNYATLASQTLIADVGKAVHMDYGTDGSGASMGDTEKGFKSMGYTVTKKDHDIDDVVREIFDRHRPVFMAGDRKEFLWFTWKGHAWVCEGVDYYTNTVSYFVEYLINRSTNPSYSSCGLPAYWAPQSSSGSGRYYLYMNWGWNGQGNAWFASNDVNATEDRNYQYNRENLYVSPQK
ncbi:MAG: C10 family peptidase [Bacteroides sp.]|nr:C10 family peptidase [Bacteroides sp.]